MDAWTPSTLIKGLGQGKVWIGRMLRTLVLDRKAYQEVARDAYMTGPALLIGLIGLALSAIVLTGAAVGSAGNATTIVARLVAWPLIVLFLMLTARVLGGKASYTSTFRVTGFAYFGYWLALLSVIPVVGPLFRAIGFLLAFLGVWLGVAQAHELRGWRTLVLPDRVRDRGGRRGRGAAHFVPGRGHYDRLAHAGCGFMRHARTERSRHKDIMPPTILQAYFSRLPSERRPRAQLHWPNAIATSRNNAIVVADVPTAEQDVLDSAREQLLAHREAAYHQSAPHAPGSSLPVISYDDPCPSCDRLRRDDGDRSHCAHG